MRSLLVLTRHTLVSLLAMQSFLGGLLVMLLASGFSLLASDWGINAGPGIFTNFCGLSFHLLGHALAIVWGVSLTSGSFRSGVLEFYMATPISRWTWVVARFLGLVLGLLVFWLVSSLVVSSLGLLFWGIELNLLWFVYLGQYLLGWACSAALAILMGTLAGVETALFASAALWVVGQVSRSVAANMPGDIPLVLAKFLTYLAKLYDMQRFSLDIQLLSQATLLSELVGLTLLYAVSWSGCVLLLSCAVFYRRDLGGRTSLS